MFKWPLPRDLALIVVEYARDPPCVPLRFASLFVVLMEEIYYDNYDYDENVNMSPSRIKKEGPPTGDNVIDAFYEDPHGRVFTREMIDIFNRVRKAGVCIDASLMSQSREYLHHIGWPKDIEPFISYKCQHRSHK